MEKDAVNEEIRKAIRSISYGNIQIIIQDSRVVQIEKTEKIRLGCHTTKKGGVREED